MDETDDAEAPAGEGPEHADAEAGDDADSPGDPAGSDAPAGEEPAAGAEAGPPPDDEPVVEWLPGDPDPVTAYLWALGTAIAGLVGGMLLFPGAVYDRFLWKYFWGPVYADAHGQTCAYLTDGGVAYEATRAACGTHATGAVVGYNTFNEIGYAATLLFALAGVVLLMRRFDVGEDPSLFWGLVPYMFLGGALRVVEDAANAARVATGAEPALTYPLNALFISPVIYFTMFFFTVAALVVAIWAERAGHVDTYERALSGIGATALGLTLLYLLVLSLTTDYVSLLPQFTVVTLLLSGVVTAAVWWGLEEYYPDLNAGTERMGVVVLFAHSVDGVANVVGLDWGAELGLPADLVGKHPVNRFVVDATSATLPESVTAVTGVAWPFLLLKVAVAVGVIAIFDEGVFEETPRYGILMLVAIVAVGLGPGTRDMLRATFGI
jgi:uncharacterized membrane protein